METLTIDDVIQATGGTFVGEPRNGVGQLRPTDVSIDSRTLKAGNLFFALHGERFDGHDFVGEAFQKGAVAAVVRRQWTGFNRDQWGSERVVITVEDTLEAFQECARYYRSLFSVPVIAVTGTNGKTTTKDMVAAVLSTKERCLKTEGNMNNHIGLPLTLFRLRSEHSFAVVELGMRAPGEIERLAHISDPHIGVITNVGPAHIEFLHSVEQIGLAKGELLDYLGPTGTAVLNADDRHVMEQRRRMRGKVVTFGLGRGADIRAVRIATARTGEVAFETGDGLSIELGMPGRPMVYNALAAIAVGRELSVPAQSAKEALELFVPPPLRMEVCTVNGVRILNDAYNANPVSMREALAALQEMPCAGRRIAVLGDMLELGHLAREAHREIGRRAARGRLSCLLTVGALSRLVADEAIVAGMDEQRVHHFESKEGVVNLLREIARSGDLILVKASRKMGLEEIVEGLRARPSGCRTVSAKRE